MARSILVNPPTIRAMRPGDVARVARLEQSIYPQPWSENVFRDELGLDNREYLVVEQDGEVVGYGGFLIVDADAHITTLAIDPEARRNRYGTHLMLALVDAALATDARHLTLEVRVSNAGAQRLYQRFGFAPVGVRKNYYRTEDALVMWAIDIRGDDYSERLAAIRADLETT